MATVSYLDFKNAKVSETWKFSHLYGSSRYYNLFDVIMVSGLELRLEEIQFPELSLSKINENYDDAKGMVSTHVVEKTKKMPIDKDAWVHERLGHDGLKNPSWNENKGIQYLSQVSAMLDDFIFTKMKAATGVEIPSAEINNSTDFAKMIGAARKIIEAPTGRRFKANQLFYFIDFGLHAILQSQGAAVGAMTVQGTAFELYSAYGLILIPCNLKTLADADMIAIAPDNIGVAIQEYVPLQIGKYESGNIYVGQQFIQALMRYDAFVKTPEEVFKFNIQEDETGGGGGSDTSKVIDLKTTQLENEVKKLKEEKENQEKEFNALLNKTKNENELKQLKKELEELEELLKAEPDNSEIKQNIAFQKLKIEELEK